jgi:transcriptional regulator with XRE-family HTH domain
MEKNILAVKIKEFRMAKGYSQEYLAELSQLSLRTIQRIENGETVPRGDTLNRLAKALEVSIDELTMLEVAIPNNNGYVALINLSALVFLVIVSFPVLSFVPPLLLWLHKKDQSEEVNERGKKILNFQITCSIIAAVWILFQIGGFIIPKVFHWNSLFSLHLGPGEILLLSLIIPIAFNVILVIINTILILTNKEMKFWPVYRFLK